MPDADYTAELQRMMTHQPEGPNPAQPYIGALRGFLQPPDLKPEHLPGTLPADYLRELYRNPDLRARAIEQAMPFAMMGSTTPKGGGKMIQKPQTFYEISREYPSRSNDAFHWGASSYQRGETFQVPPSHLTKEQLKAWDEGVEARMRFEAQPDGRP